MTVDGGPGSAAGGRRTRGDERAPLRRARRPPGDGRDCCASTGIPVAGRFVQVGIPLRLSVDTPAVKGPAPTPAPVRRRRTGAAAHGDGDGDERDVMKIDSGLGAELPRVADRVCGGGGRSGLHVGGRDDQRSVLVVDAGGRASSRVSIGTGVAIAFARNPMSLAYTTNQLQEYSGGRVMLGLGSQVRRHIERRFSMTWSRPAARMREYVLALRAIWASWNDGGPARVPRRVLHAHVDDAGVRAPAACVRGASGLPCRRRAPDERGRGRGGRRRASRTASARAGTCARSRCPRSSGGSARSGRTRADIEITCPGFIVGGGGPTRRWRRRVAPCGATSAYYASTPAYRPVLELHGWGDLQTELYACSKQGRWDEMARLVDDEVLDTLTIMCEPDGWRAGGRALRRARRPHQRVVVAGRVGPDVEKALRAL